MRTTYTVARRPRCRTFPLLLALLPALAACDTADLLSVHVPGRVAAEALDDPTLARTLIDGVQGDFECAWNQYVAAAAVHSDEFIPTSANLINQQWGARQMTGSVGTYNDGGCTANYAFFRPLHTARFQADDIFQRLEAFGSDLPAATKVSFQATARAYGAYTLVAFGEGTCEGTVDGGALLTPAEMLSLAEEQFTHAIELATQAGNEDILNMALVGRARVRVNLEKFDLAIQDAVRVPSGYLKVATRDASTSRRWNRHWDAVHRVGHASVAPNFRGLEWMGVPDPRVNVSNTGRLGFDTATPLWIHDKATSLASPIPIASYKEAQLLIAEAAARTGDLETARRIINERHALANLPGYDPGGTATAEEVLAMVIEQRRRELFAEGGHRLNDMLRFRGGPHHIPFLGEPGSIHPDGITQAGLSYGSVTCFELPDVERFGNPNV